MYKSYVISYKYTDFDWENSAGFGVFPSQFCCSLIAAFVLANRLWPWRSRLMKQIALFVFVLCFGPVALADQTDFLPRANVYVIGEIHDNVYHHVRQAELTAAIMPKALVFEMLSAEDAQAIDPEKRRDVNALHALNWWERGADVGAHYAPILLAAPEAQVFGAHVRRERARAAIQQGAASYFGVQSEIFGLSEPLGHEEQAAREAHQLAAHCDALPSEILPLMVDIQRLRDAELARATAQALAKTDGPVVVITGNGHARKDWGMPVYLTKATADLLVYSIGQGETGLMPEGVFDEVTYSPAASRDDPCAAFSKD